MHILHVDHSILFIAVRLFYHLHRLWAVLFGHFEIVLKNNKIYKVLFFFENKEFRPKSYTFWAKPPKLTCIKRLYKHVSGNIFLHGPK